MRRARRTSLGAQCTRGARPEFLASARAKGRVLSHFCTICHCGYPKEEHLSVCQCIENLRAEGTRFLSVIGPYRALKPMTNQMEVEWTEITDGNISDGWRVALLSSWLRCSRAERRRPRTVALSTTYCLSTQGQL